MKIKIPSKVAAAVLAKLELESMNTLESLHHFYVAPSINISVLVSHHEKNSICLQESENKSEYNG